VGQGAEFVRVTEQDYLHELLPEVLLCLLISNDSLHTPQRQGLAGPLTIHLLWQRQDSDEAIGVDPLLLNILQRVPGLRQVWYGDSAFESYGPLPTLSCRQLAAECRIA